MNSKSIVEYGVFFCGVLLLVGVSWSAFGIYGVGVHDPKWSPQDQFLIEVQLNFFVSVQAAIGYGLSRWLLPRPMIATRFASHAIKVAGIFIVCYVIWFHLIFPLWMMLFEANAPSPVSGIWGTVDDAITIASIFLVCPALGFLATSITKS